MSSDSYGSEQDLNELSSHSESRGSFDGDDGNEMDGDGYDEDYGSSDDGNSWDQGGGYFEIQEVDEE